MKKTTGFILIGIIIVLAAVLAGTLLYLKNQPTEERAVIQPLVTVEPMEPDSSIWGTNYPNEYDTWLLTASNSADTEYGGSSGYSQLERDPRQVILFTGYPFSKDYNDDRGHGNALTDVNTTLRVNDKTHATCYSCKSSNNPALWDELGLEGYDAMMFSEMTPNLTESIGCVNCHEAGTMRLIVTNPSLENALEAQGRDWTT
ncbi:ammonia-forming cytochrome c nitrite reductase subunit c552, partial [bacterium]|nr:ammonia-forming cytochrome c nitrite reductase subunit c552 [bacterium]